MSTFAPQRLNQRVSVGGEFRASFKLGARSFTRLPLTNLGAGGCCLKVDAPTAAHLSKGALLQELVIRHPGLPELPQQALVVWMLGRPAPKARPPEEGFVLVGIKFIRPSPHFQFRVHEYVSLQLGIPVVA